MQIQRSTIVRTARCFALLVLLAGLSSVAWAGPDSLCGDGLCNKGEKPDSCWLDCGGDTPDSLGNIFEARFGVGTATSMITSMKKLGENFTYGSIYTRPEENLSADPKNVNFNTNGGNEVTIEIDTSYLQRAFTREEIEACFPDAANNKQYVEYEGSLHLNDYFKQRADLAAYFWFWVGDVQYVFEFRDDGSGWYDDNGNTAEFPPSYGETIQRDAWIWLLRVTTRNAENPCVTDGNIVAGTSTDPIVTFNLGLVDGCEYPYDTVGCQ